MFDPLSAPTSQPIMRSSFEQPDAPSSPSPWGDSPSRAPIPRTHTQSPAQANRDKPLPDPAAVRPPQIYGRPEPSLVSPSAKGAEGDRAGHLFLRVRITGVSKNRRDYSLSFDINTNLPHYRTFTYRGITRTYAEFTRLAEQLALANPQTIVPALPYCQTSAPTDEEDDRLVRLNLQRWFSRVCDDAVLRTDEETRSFVESDFGYQPIVRAKRRTGSSFKLSLSRGPPDDDRELADGRYEVAKLEEEFEKVGRAVEKVSKARRGLATANTELGGKLINVASAEAHPPLGNALRKMGRAVQNVADLEQAHAASELVTLFDTLIYQSMNARAAKDTLIQRTQVLEEYQSAVKSTIGKRRNMERLKGSSSIRPDKVDDALHELEEANKYEQQLAQKVAGMSQNLHGALAVHSRNAHDDLHMALLENARGAIIYERHALKELESLRSDIRSISAPPTLAPSPNPTLTPPLAGPSSNGALSPQPSPAPSAPASPAPAPRRRASNDSLSPADPLLGRATRSMYLPHARAASEDPRAAAGRMDPRARVNTLARSVHVEGANRVSAREAASKLANMF